VAKKNNKPKKSKKVKKVKKVGSKKSNDETGHRQGKKLGKRHTTTIRAVGRIIDFINPRRDVSHIMPGIIKNVGSGEGGQRIRISMLNGAMMLLKVRGKTAVQELRVTSSAPAAVKAAIKKEFKEEFKIS